MGSSLIQMPSIVTIRVGSRAIVAKREGKRFTKDKFVLKTWTSILRRRMHRVGCRRTDIKVKFAADPVKQYIDEYSNRIPRTPTICKSMSVADIHRGPRGGIIQSVTISCPPECWLCAKRAFLYID